MKNVVITGGTRGIGAAISEELCLSGFNVAAVYKSNHTAANELIKKLRGKRLKVYKADVSDYKAVQKLVAEIRTDFDTTDVLINNAGIAVYKSYENINYQDWLQTIQANLTSTFIVTQAFLPVMLAARKGKIINISSVAAFAGGIVGPHYTASKAGQIGLTHYYAKALASYNIMVNAIAPALIETEMVKETTGANVDLIPLKRLGKTKEVADAVKFLIDSDFVTGQTIHVNGGLLFS